MEIPVRIGGEVDRYRLVELPFRNPGHEEDPHETFSSGLPDLRHRRATRLFGIRPGYHSRGPGIEFARREQACQLHGELATAPRHFLPRVADGPLLPRGFGCHSVLRR